MSVKFTSQSSPTNQRECDPGAVFVNCIELETTRSPRLSEMMRYIRRYEDAFLSLQRVASLGITVIVLPGTGSFFSDEGPFRPHSPCNIEMIDTSGDERLFDDKDSEADLVGTFADIFFDLEYASKKLFEESLMSKGVDESNATFPWRYIRYVPTMSSDEPCNIRSLDLLQRLKSSRHGHRSFTVLDSLSEIDSSDDISCTSRIYEWQQKRKSQHESGKLLPVTPHLLMDLETECRCNENMLTRHEMMVILSAIYGRLYDQDFKDERFFPILVIMQYDLRRARIAEAVFDAYREKLTLRLTPMYSFVKKDDSPYELFLRLAASSPRV